MCIRDRGQYYPVDSFIHKLDPRTKLFGTMVYIISLFLADGIVGYLISAVFLAIVIRVSKVPFKFIVKGIKPILFLLLFSVIFNHVSYTHLDVYKRQVLRYR